MTAQRVQQASDAASRGSDEATTTTAQLAQSCTSTKGKLCVLRHGVRLVQDDKLHTLAEQLLRAREALDLLPHDVDAAVV